MTREVWEKFSTVLSYVISCRMQFCWWKQTWLVPGAANYNLQCMTWQLKPKFFTHPSFLYLCICTRKTQKHNF